MLFHCKSFLWTNKIQYYAGLKHRGVDPGGMRENIPLQSSLGDHSLIYVIMRPLCSSYIIESVTDALRVHLWNTHLKKNS